MKVRPSAHLWLAFLFFGLAASAQEIEVTGTVTDPDGMPLPGVNVIVKNTNNGVLTNFDGEYSITTDVGDVLVFSYLGFETQEIEVQDPVINVSMKEDVSMLSEVVVTGYTTQLRSEMATSVSKLDTKVLKSAPRTNPATALQGTIAGLKVTQTTGQPGSTPSITLRGGTTFGGGGSPLVLINGVPGSFYALNSADIASIEVLKDAASTAIYGARAANGVILITTKSGTPGQSQITYRHSYTINRLPDTPNYLEAKNFILYNRRSIINTQRVLGETAFQSFLTGPQSMGTGNNTTNSPFTTMFLSDENRYLLDHPGWLTMEDPVTGETLIFRNNDMSELFFQNSYASRHDLSFSGGNEKGTYYLGLGYLDNKGLVIGSGFERFSGNLNASYNITDKFKVTSNIIYAHSSISGTYLGNDRFVFQRAAGQPPTSRIFNTNPDGTLSDIPNPGTNFGFGNPLYYGDKFLDDNLEQRLTAAVQFDWEFAKNFNLMVQGSHFTINNSNESFNKAYLNAGALITTRTAGVSHDRTVRNQATAIVSYNNTFNEKHDVDILVGGEYFRDNDFGLSAGTRLSPTDLIHTLNAGAEANGVPSSFHTSYSIISQFAQLNYVYDDRYLVGLTVRRDGTSRLANRKYDVFPGVSVGWNIHNENFFQDFGINSFVSRLKPRVSYGVNGNIDVLSNYGVFGLYSETDVYDTQTGYGNSNLPVLDLTWERSTTLNFGLDVGLFDDRISILADYFIRDVEDKLADLPLPLWTGFSSILTNNGVLRNKGLELELNAVVVNSEDWNWTLGGTYFTQKGYVQKLPENGLENNRQDVIEIYDPATGDTQFVGGLQEGQRVGLDIVTAYIPMGVYNTEAELQEDAGRVVQFASDPEFQQLGDTRWKDLNGDNIIDFKDRMVIGRTTPEFFGGITSDLTYKNFNLFIKTDFAMGHLILNASRLRGMSQVQGNQNWTTEILKTWTPGNSDSNVPRFDFTDPQGNHQAGGGSTGSQYSDSARYWEKGDYFSLREVTLSYTFDNEPIKNVLQNLRLYISGGNITYFSDYTGNSPEEGGIDRGRFPLPITYTVGVSATF
ncbi:MAG TPA: SusC/RagA family TonB-linked outer membrane protein [Salinimicrobium sp.]|nr:SusC/RagA family TonB-linked outer membrane protein [Salinimicrobium sp.]